MQQRRVLVQGKDGLMYETGFAVNQNGQYCNCAKTPGFVPNQRGAFGRGFAELSPTAYNQLMQQMQSGASGMNNSFGRVDLPNQGAVGVARLDMPSSPVNASKTFQITLNNSAGATQARQIIGDYPGAYVLNGNTEVTPGGFLIGGTWGTNSKSQFAIQPLGRPWRVKKVQMISAFAADATLAPAFFNLTSLFYFDQGPTTDAPTKDNITPTTLLSADQYNPSIQWYDRSIMFNGYNGFDVTIPAGYSVTFAFIIESLGIASDQVLAGRG